MIRFIFILATISFLASCGGVTQEFRKTDSGTALLKCVAGGGSLELKDIPLESRQKGIDVILIKNNKKIKMQFSVNEKINQASLVGAEIEGEENLTRLLLMINLELLCGGELSSKILPDDYRNLLMIDKFQRMFR
jgi:hypothetical protein